MASIDKILVGVGLDPQTIALLTAHLAKAVKSGVNDGSAEFSKLSGGLSKAVSDGVSSGMKKARDGAEEILKTTSKGLKELRYNLKLAMVAGDKGDLVSATKEYIAGLKSAYSLSSKIQAAELKTQKEIAAGRRDDERRSMQYQREWSAAIRENSSREKIATNEKLRLQRQIASEERRSYARSIPGRVGSAVGTMASYAIGGAIMAVPYKAGQYVSQGMDRQENIYKALAIGSSQGASGIFSGFNSLSDAVLKTANITGMAASQIDGLALSIAQAGIKSQYSESVMLNMAKAMRLSFGELDPKLAIQGFNTLKNTFFKGLPEAEAYSAAIQGINKSIALANVTSSDPRQIIEAMARVGGGASMAGFSYDKMAALLVGAQERSGVSAVSFATTMRRTSAKFYAPETMEKLKGFGVQVRDPNTGDLLKQAEIFDLLAKKYQELILNQNETKASELALAAAGSVQYSNLIQLLGAWGDVDKTLGRVSDAQKMNNEQIEKANEALNVSFTRLNNAMEQIGIAFVSSSTGVDLLKVSINGLASGIETIGIDGIASSIGVVIPLLGAAATQVGIINTALGGMASYAGVFGLILADLQAAINLYKMYNEMAGLSSDNALINKTPLATKTEQSMAAHSVARSIKTYNPETNDYEQLSTEKINALTQILSAQDAPVAALSAAKGLLLSRPGREIEKMNIENLTLSEQKKLLNEELSSSLGVSSNELGGIIDRFITQKLGSKIVSTKEAIGSELRDLVASGKTEEKARSIIAYQKMGIPEKMKAILEETKQLQDDYEFQKRQYEDGELKDIGVLQSFKTRADEKYKEMRELASRYAPTEEKAKIENTRTIQLIENATKSIRGSVSSLSNKATASAASLDRKEKKAVKNYWDTLNMAIKDGTRALFEKRTNSVSGFLDYAIDSQISAESITLTNLKPLVSKMTPQLTTAMFAAGGMTGAIPGMAGKSSSLLGINNFEISRYASGMMGGISGGLVSGLVSGESELSQWTSDKEKKEAIELQKKANKDFEDMLSNLVSIGKHTSDIAEGRSKLSAFENKAGNMIADAIAGKKFSSGELFGDLLGPIMQKSGGNMARSLTRISVGGSKFSLDEIIGLASGNMPQNLIGMQSGFAGATGAGYATAGGVVAGMSGIPGAGSSVSVALQNAMTQSAIQKGASSKFAENLLGKGNMDILQGVGQIVSYYGYIKAAGAILKSAGIGTDRIRQDDRSTVDSQNALISDLFGNLKSKGTELTADDIRRVYGYTPSYSTAVKTSSKRGGLQGFLGGKDTSYTTDNAGAKSIEDLYKMTYDSIINAGTMELELKDNEIDQMYEKLSRGKVMISMLEGTKSNLEKMATLEVEGMKLRQQIYDTTIAGYMSASGISSGRQSMYAISKKYGNALSPLNRVGGLDASYSMAMGNMRSASWVGRDITAALPINQWSNSGVNTTVGSKYSKELEQIFGKNIGMGYGAGDIRYSTPAYSDIVSGLTGLVSALDKTSKTSPEYDALIQLINIGSDMLTVQQNMLQDQLATTNERIAQTDYLAGIESTNLQMQESEKNGGQKYSDFVKKYLGSGTVSYYAGDGIGPEGLPVSFVGERSTMMGDKYRFQQEAIAKRLSAISQFSGGAFSGSELLTNLFNADYIGGKLGSMESSLQPDAIASVKQWISELQSSMSSLMGSFASGTKSSAANNEESKMYEVNSTGKYYITQNFSVASTYFGGSQAEAVQFLKFLSKAWNDSGIKNSGSKLF